MIFVNARNLGVHTTGVQRYTKKIIECWDAECFKLIKPEQSLHGVKGHMWEQCILPLRLRGGTVWSPSNTGPLAVCNQVLTIHDVVPFDHPEWLNPRFVSWYKFLQPKLVKNVAHIITISEFSKQRIMDVLKVHESKISVIYNGVDSVNQSDIIPQDALNLPFKTYALAVGSIEPRKNIGRLIAAWRLLKDELPEDTGLVIVGAKGLERVFSNVTNNDLLSSNDDRIHFTGHVTDVVLSSLYKHASVFCYPSLYEGFGLPPLEAMAYNIPVITSNTTAMYELCHGSAVLVSPFDIEEIASAIFSTLANSDTRKIQSAKLLVSSLSWKTCAQKTLDIIEGVG